MATQKINDKKEMDNKINISRSNFEKLGTLYKKADNVIIEKEIIKKINCYWLYKNEIKPGNKIIIYLHGGCFVLGSINSHQALVSHLADELDIPVLFIEYGLAPENPFPSAINDILEVYQYILQKKQTQDIVFMGDSAGAGLAMSVISILDKKNINKPAHLVMLSPWIDLNASNNSITSNAAIDPILTKEQLQLYTSLYLGSSKVSAANPIEIMAGNFPPTLILVGSREILVDDSKMAYSKISEKQPLTKLKVYDNQTHVWLLDDIQTEASKNAIKEIRNFISN
ncbi:MAG: alpha/beta hydrolase [Bacteroidota bacterium]|nr:alpha/beta hydrolase [Bacteroidota bacterium]